MARKRILEILSSCDYEGGWRQCALLAAQLPPQEFDVQFCLLSRNRSGELLLKKTSLPVHAVGYGHKPDFWVLWPLVRLIRQWKPDLLHSWDSTANVYGPLAGRIAGVKTIFCSVSDATDQKSKGKIFVDRLLKKHITKIIIPSRRLCDVNHTLMHFANEKLVVIPPAIAMTPNTTIDREDLLQKLQIPENSQLIAISDPMQVGNRLRDVIWATELLKVAGNNVQVFICGKGPQRKALERFRNHVHLQDRIHFLDDHHLIDQLMEHLDLFWKISGYSYTAGNQLIEAMRRAIPVIADESLVHQEFIQHEKTGILVPIGDRAALASWTQHLLENPEYSKRIGTTGQTAVKNKYDPKTTILAQTKLYQQTLKHYPLSYINTPKP
jgi:glycosyltransferase involved in cell wall biosynthesis